MHDILPGDQQEGVSGRRPGITNLATDPSPSPSSPSAHLALLQSPAIHFRDDDDSDHPLLSGDI